MVRCWTEEGREIIIMNWVSMSVDTFGYPYPRIYVPANFSQRNEPLLWHRGRALKLATCMSVRGLWRWPL